MKKEFDYHLSVLGDFFNLEWTAKDLKFKKIHHEEIDEKIRIENLTDKPLVIKISEHDIIKHDKIIKLKPKEVKLIEILIDCSKIKKMHKSYLIMKSPNQEVKIPVEIEHMK